MPIAVERLAYAAEGEPNLSLVRRRWAEERTAMLNRGGSTHPQLNVAASFEVSILSPRMTEDARRLLSLLGVLPDGIGHDDLRNLLPSVGDHAASILRKVGLAFDEAGRLRALKPIRDHVRAQHPPRPNDLARAITYYCALAQDLGAKVGRGGGAKAIARLSIESANLESMILIGLRGAFA